MINQRVGRQQSYDYMFYPLVNSQLDPGHTEVKEVKTKVTERRWKLGLPHPTKSRQRLRKAIPKQIQLIERLFPGCYR